MGGIFDGLCRGWPHGSLFDSSRPPIGDGHLDYWWELEALEDQRGRNPGFEGIFKVVGVTFFTGGSLGFLIVSLSSVFQLLECLKW